MHHCTMHIYLAATCCMVDKSFAEFLNLTYGIFLPPPGASRLPRPPPPSLVQVPFPPPPLFRSGFSCACALTFLSLSACSRAVRAR